ncbi:MAG: hypothetical protein QW692_02540 [Nitrososphaerota archaeon]
MGISLLESGKEEEIRRAVEEERSIDEAVTRILEIHSTPLTFSDILKLLPEHMRHKDRLSRCLKRLLRQNIIQKVVVIWYDGAYEGYAIRTDTSILAAVPVRDLREMGYRVLIGVKVEGQGEGYPLMEVEGDALLIHIDRSEYGGHSILTTEKGNFVIYTPRLKEEVNGDLHEHNGQEV